MSNIRYMAYTLTRKYLLNVKMGRKAYTVLYAIADAVASEEMKAFRENRCPFCGRKFPNKATLAAHLKITSWRPIKIPSYGADYRYIWEIVPTNPCPYLFISLINYIVEAYVRIRHMIYTRAHRVVIDLSDGRKRFNNMAEFAEFLRSNPSVVEEVMSHQNT